MSKSFAINKMAGVSLGLALVLSAPVFAADPQSAPPSAASCFDQNLMNTFIDRASFWTDSATRRTVLERVQQITEETGGIQSLLVLEIGLSGSQPIYNSLWFIETPKELRSLAVETPDGEGKLPSFAERTLEPGRYALLWDELTDLRLWNTPSDSQTVGLRAEIPVFYGTFCRNGKVHRIRIENPPLPTWGKDDTFDQARRRHDKKAREFMLRPRDRAIEVMRLIQAF